MTLQEECEQSFYRKLYDYPGIGTLYLDEITGRIWLEKTRDIYSLPVYEWLADHRSIHIPEILDFYEQDGDLHVFEEFVQGQTLEELLQDPDSSLHLSAYLRKQILLGVCEAVRFLHSAVPPIIHRDIKPSNIMLNPDNVVKLIDFDAAKFADPTEQQDTTLIGTHGVAAPEQYGFGSSSERTDIYAIGVLIRTLFPDDPRFLRIAAHATRLEPQQRYHSVQELEIAIRNIRNTESSHSHRKKRSVWIGWVFIAAAATAFAVLLVAQLLPTGRTGSSASSPASYSSSPYESISAGDSGNSISTTQISSETSSPADSTSGDHSSLSFQNNVITTPGYTITITDWKVLQPGEGNNFGDVPIVGFWYDVTNTSGDSIDPVTAWILTLKAVQDNDANRINELNVGLLPDAAYLDTQSETIKKGGTVSCAISYEPDDLTTPVTLIATDDNLNEFGRADYPIADR